MDPQITFSKNPKLICAPRCCNRENILPSATCASCLDCRKITLKKICDLDFCILIKKIIGIFPYQLQSLGAGVNSGVTKDVTTAWVGCYFIAGYHEVSRLPTYTPM